jgi:hypothetical protein
MAKNTLDDCVDIPEWFAPEKKLPSATYLGEIDKDALHTRVGSALDEWETLESSLALIFRHLVESKSAASLRVYGAILSTRSRKEALQVAAAEFFRGKSDTISEKLNSLLNAYEKASQYRNNIAHGICYGWLYIDGKKTAAPNWFLCPPNHNTRKRKNGIDNSEAEYIYKAADIEHCETRFKQLSSAATVLGEYLRKTYPLR